MVKRSAEAWGLLFAEQESSGKSAAAFCRERKLCPKYFSLRKKQLSWEETKGAQLLPSAFVELERETPAPASRVILRLGRCEWEFFCKRQTNTILSSATTGV